MKTFLICHRGALGDFILTWPALRRLREKLPDYRFLCIGRTEYVRLAMSFGLLDDCLDKETAGLLDFFSGKTIPENICFPHGAPHGGILWLTDCQKIVDLLMPSATLPVVAITPFPTIRTHLARYYCSVIQSYFSITIPQELSDCFPYRAGGGRYALVHPGSGSQTKNYKPQFYRNVAAELRLAGFLEVGFIFGPVEEEKMNAADFDGEWIERPKDVDALAELLSEASFYIGNDSGVSHLSGFVGIPTIALYKTTDPKIWGVLGRKVVHISAADEAYALREIRKCLRKIIVKQGIYGSGGFQ